MVAASTVLVRLKLPPVEEEEAAPDDDAPAPLLDMRAAALGGPGAETERSEEEN